MAASAVWAHSGRSATGSMGFGVWVVSGRIRVPSPAARRTVCIPRSIRGCGIGVPFSEFDPDGTPFSNELRVSREHVHRGVEEVVGPAETIVAQQQAQSWATDVDRHL